MSTQTIRSGSPGEATATTLATWNPLGDPGHPQLLALATKITCAMSRGPQAMRKIKGADHATQAIATAA